jgi:hypothetical protein
MYINSFIYKNVYKNLKFREKRLKIYNLPFFLFLFSLALIFFFIAYLQNIQIIIFGNKHDLVFPLPITSLSSFFMLLFPIFIDIVIDILLIFPKMKNLLLMPQYEEMTEENILFLKKMNIRYYIFMAIFFTVAIFLSISVFFVHLKINNSGIYYNKIFSFNEKYFEWEKLNSVSINCVKGKNTLTPEMILQFGDNKIDIWGGMGLGAPSSEKLIKAINLINENTTIKINFDNNISNEILYILNNNYTEESRKNIIDVFEYLKKM